MPTQAQKTIQKTKQCPYCGEDTGLVNMLFRVLFEDAKCPNCGRVVEKVDMVRNTDPITCADC